jgi:hypothetical protein
VATFIFEDAVQNISAFEIASQSPGMITKQRNLSAGK